MQPLAEDDFLLDVNGGILELRPNSQQGKRWNLSDCKDQRENLWLIRKKDPKLVTGCGKFILFCTVLYPEQTGGRGLVLARPHGNAFSSLSLHQTLECRNDVFHALSNARDRRDENE